MALRGEISSTSPFEMAAAEARVANRQLDAAIEKYDRVLSRSPGNLAALSGKAAALTGLRRFDDASRAYRQIIDHAPRNAEARYNFGVVLCRLSRFGEAAEQFREVLVIDSRHARGLHNLAILAQRAGRLTEARDAWEAFTRLQPEVAGAWYNLGVVWLDLEKPLDGLRCFAIASVLEPDDPGGHLNHALALSAAGCLPEALDAAWRAESLAPCDFHVHEVLTELLDSRDHGGELEIESTGPPALSINR